MGEIRPIALALLSHLVIAAMILALSSVLRKLVRLLERWYPDEKWDLSGSGLPFASHVG